MSDTWARRAPFTGIASAVVALAAIIIGGETPAFDASPNEILDFYGDSKQFFVGALIALAGVLFAFFAGTLRSRLRKAESLSTMTLVGGTVFAIGLAIFGGLNLTLADLADTDKQIDPAALQAINALNSDLFLPVAAGVLITYWSTGLAILSSGAMPRWFGWVTVALGVIALLGPGGFFAFVAMLPWTLVAAILLLMGGDEAAPAPPSEPVGT